MPRAPPAMLRGLGRPIVYTVAAGTVAIGAPLAIGHAVKASFNSYNQARNPPLQYRTVDPNPYMAGDESTLAFDPRTGRTLTFGAKPTDKGDNERSEERTQQLLIYGGIAAVVLVFVLRGGI